jgi:hypothetical protein
LLFTPGVVNKFEFFLHDISPWHAVMAYRHDIPPWHTATTYRHGIPPWHTAMTYRHDLNKYRNSQPVPQPVLVKSIKKILFLKKMMLGAGGATLRREAQLCLKYNTILPW